MVMKKIVIAGFGGQGVLLIGQMLAYAAMYENREVTWMPSYGPEMRGGTANCTVVISDEPIASPLAGECDILAVMNGPSLDKFEETLATGGELFVNESMVPRRSGRNDITVHYVDCAGIASERLGSAKAANMVMLGAIVRKTGIVDMLTMEKVCEAVFRGSKAQHIPMNQSALKAWEA